MFATRYCHNYNIRYGVRWRKYVSVPIQVRFSLGEAGVIMSFRWPKHSDTVLVLVHFKGHFEENQ